MTDTNGTPQKAKTPKQKWESNIAVFTLGIAIAAVAGSFGTYLWVRSEIDTRVSEQLQLQLPGQLNENPLREIISGDLSDARNTLKEANKLSISAQEVVKDVEAQKLAAAQATSAIQVRIQQLEKDIDASRVLSAIERQADEAIAGLDEELVRRLTFPADAVVAFAKARPKGVLPNGPADDPCPDGWNRYAEADGMTIVGVGPDDTPFRKDGERKHAMTTEEIPDHRHDFYSARWFRPFGGDVNALTDAVLDIGGVNRDGAPYKKDMNLPNQVSLENLPGTERYNKIYDAEKTRFTNAKGAPHNNMPPYIALYFCKKEG